MEQAKTRQEIAAEYGVSRDTLRAWLKRENIKLTPGRVTPAELNVIYEKFGHTSKLQSKKFGKIKHNDAKFGKR